ncbi:MAG: Flp pilus assembly protein CpaB [Rhodospirillaceae bacterium]|jgi:pilus assembly protein CpaB|nr:Flp pilus assembly protein CpaB [Rhodospirillaceae bacterium]MBT7953946.1 Flp pilus assembly protein CpaB [Rhodospirillaceae bacterium]
MTLRTILLLVSALAAAGATAMMTRSWLNAQSAKKQVVVKEKKDTGVFVLVAAQKLSAGSFVQDKHLKWQAWPKEGVSKGYIQKPVQLAKGKNGKEKLLGAVLRSAVNVGDPVTEQRIVHPGDRGFLAAVLTPGQRAVSVPVNATTGISGFVFPGDQVDLILTVKFRSDDEEGKAQTRYFSETLLEDIRVLAIDQQIEVVDGKVKPLKTVTVEVTPKQAERVAIALEMGSISLSLHSLARKGLEGKLAQLQKSQAPKKSFTLDKDVYFMGHGTKRKSKRQAYKIDVIRGEKAEETKF